MTVMTVAYFEHVKDYLHPNLKHFINEYKEENIIMLPPFHGCGHRNKNGTRKLINYTTVINVLLHHGVVIGKKI